MYREGVKIKRIGNDGSMSIQNDNIAVDTPFCIFVDDLPFRTLISSPEKLRELALGHLLTEGVIKSRDDISEESIRVGRADIYLKNPVDLTEINFERERVITTACNTENVDMSILEGLKVKEIDAPDPKVIFDLMRKLNENSVNFKATGGTHSAILSYMDDDFIESAEDVGRHNAIDKAIGSGMIHGYPLDKCILACSGRLSGDMVLKAARSGIPIMCSISAPLLSGIKVAEKTGIKLYGFVRARRFNQYTLD
ncbi:formate dehydrogenase accessory sulfurtransferase FdhD [Candidatus Bathyarchaeota archaeon]|jgi:FdhD protein|nr:formate dehydrogenase accessory sulfurtransferase FdhD [Candidatus Bathyarchaeota archaeon]